jgi:hypothetical protein
MDLAALIKFQQLYYNICGSAHNQWVNSAICWLLKTQGKITCSWCNQKPKLSFLALFFNLFSQRCVKRQQTLSWTWMSDFIITHINLYEHINKSCKFTSRYSVHLLLPYIRLEWTWAPAVNKGFFLIYSICPFPALSPPFPLNTVLTSPI